MAAWILAAGVLVAALAFVPGLGYAEAVVAPLLAHRLRKRTTGPLRGPAHPREGLMAKGVVLVVIDGLTPSVFERAETPALTFLREHGTYRRAVSTFPSLTPVCASSIATGSHPDVHHIPHLVWFDREERRLVEYGSSFAALVAAGTRRSLVDTIFNMNAKHLGPAPTVFEALDDAGLRTAAVNFTCYRGRTEHRSTFPGVTRTVRGPQRFFFYNVFQSDVTGAPLSFRNRDAGTIDDYAAAVGRWLVTRDCFDFFLFYLSDYDYASHSLGPEGAAGEARRRRPRDRRPLRRRRRAGRVPRALRPDPLLRPRPDAGAHGRPAGGRVRRPRALPPLPPGARRRRRLRVQPRGPGLPAAALRRARARAGRAARRRPRRGRDALPRGRRRRRPREPGRSSASAPTARVAGDPAVLDDANYPDAFTRAWAALHNPKAGDVLVSAADGFEFTDLGGGNHVGGGSHGSLSAGDSEVPMLAVGIDEPPASITGIAPAVLERLGVSLSLAS